MIDRAAATEVIGVDFTVRAGDRFDLLGHQMIVAETEWRSGFGRYVTAWLVPPLLAVVWRLKFLARVEGRERPLAGECWPGHDPPVAWEVHDHPFAKLGIPVIAAPGMPLSKFQVGSPRYMDPEPIILAGEPGQRP